MTTVRFRPLDGFTETMEGPTVCTAVQFAQVLFKLAWFFFVSAKECAEHLEPWAASRFMHPAPADRDEGWRSLQELWRRGTYLRKKLKLFSAEVTQPAMDRALHTSATRTAIAPLTEHGLQSGFAVGVAGEEAQARRGEGLCCCCEEQQWCEETTHLCVMRDARSGAASVQCAACATLPKFRSLRTRRSMARLKRMQSVAVRPQGAILAAVFAC